MTRTEGSALSARPTAGSPTVRRHAINRHHDVTLVYLGRSIGGASADACLLLDLSQSPARALRTRLRPFATPTISVRLQVPPTTASSSGTSLTDCVVSQAPAICRAGFSSSVTRSQSWTKRLNHARLLWPKPQIWRPIEKMHRFGLKYISFMNAHPPRCACISAVSLSSSRLHKHVSQPVTAASARARALPS